MKQQQEEKDLMFYPVGSATGACPPGFREPGLDRRSSKIWGDNRDCAQCLDTQVLISLVGVVVIAHNMSRKRSVNFLVTAMA
jgi:hypothetical protein